MLLLLLLISLRVSSSILLIFSNYHFYNFWWSSIISLISSSLILFLWWWHSPIFLPWQVLHGSLLLYYLLNYTFIFVVKINELSKQVFINPRANIYTLPWKKIPGALLNKHANNQVFSHEFPKWNYPKTSGYRKNLQKQLMPKLTYHPLRYVAKLLMVIFSNKSSPKNLYVSLTQWDLSDFVLTYTD